MFKRNVESKLKKALSRSPVVLLTGPRQCGKTTLMKEVAQNDGYHFVTFDNIATMAAAKNDPMGFIKNLQKPVIIDEVQRVPEIFLAIKLDVDENRVSGRYALTGSSNIFLIPKLGDSLAGRMEIIDLYPLSQGEIHGKVDSFIDIVFEGKIPDFQQISRENLLQRMEIGGYPTVQDKDEEDRIAWIESYINTLLERDIKDLSQISGFLELPKLLHMIAARSGSLVNFSDLSRTSGIPSSTLQRYIALLDTIYLIHSQHAWSSNIGNRAIKSPKIYLIDTGILSYLVGATSKNRFLNTFIGSLFETFVVNEILKQITWNKTRVKMYHLRMHSGSEVDIILENAQSEIVGIEVKSSTTVSPRDFNGLKNLSEHLGVKFLKGFVLYNGDAIIPFGDKIFAIPMSCLWSETFL